MNSSIETTFVRKCIKKEYQDRLLFELQSKKHREKVVSRFSHSAEAMLKSGFVKCTVCDLQKYVDFNKESLSYFIISGDSNDGNTLNAKEMVEYCKNSFMAVIAISSKLVVIKEEYEGKSPTVFIYKNI
jgi:hypothetical protein